MELDLWEMQSPFRTRWCSLSALQKAGYHLVITLECTVGIKQEWVTNSGQVVLGIHLIAFPFDSMVEPQSGTGNSISSGFLQQTDFPLLFCCTRKSEVYYFLLCCVGLLRFGGRCALSWTPVKDLGRIVVLTHFVAFWGVERTKPGQGDVGATNGLHVCALGLSALWVCVLIQQLQCSFVCVDGAHLTAEHHHSKEEAHQRHQEEEEHRGRWGHYAAPIPFAPGVAA